jgi:hypothetical protein
MTKTAGLLSVETKPHPAHIRRRSQEAPDGSRRKPEARDQLVEFAGKRIIRAGEGSHEVASGDDAYELAAVDDRQPVYPPRARSTLSRPEAQHPV